MNEDLDIFVRRTTMELMLTLYKQGIYEVHVGGMMRLLGVDEEFAAEHDDERILIDEEFAKYLQTIIAVWEDDVEDGVHSIH